jgi:hypothetical protein
VDYFARDKAQAVVFSNFSELMWAAWLEKTLRKLKSSSATANNNDID